MKALNKGNILGVRKYQEGGSTPISQMASRPVQQIEMPTRNQGLISPYGGVPKSQRLEDLPTSQLWEQVTGTPWSEAHKRGHSDYGRESNMELRQILTGSDPIGTLDYIEKESDKALKQEEVVKNPPSPAPPVKSWEGAPSPNIIAKPGDQSFPKKVVTGYDPSQTNSTSEVVNTNNGNYVDPKTLPPRSPGETLKVGPATGGGFNWAGAGIIGGGALAIGGAAFHKPIGKMITARYQRMKAAKAAKTAPFAAVETPETVVETSAPVTETAPVVAAKEPVVAPAENASATTPTEVVKPTTTPTKTSTVSKTASGNVSKAPATVNVKEAKLVRRPGTTTVEAPVVTPKEAPAYFENNNTSAPTSFQKMVAESGVGKPQAPAVAPTTTVEKSITNRNRTSKAKATTTTTSKKAPSNIKGKNSTEPTSFQETAQEVVKPQETATAPETAVQTSIKNRTTKTGTTPKETQPSLFDEVGKVAETVGEGVGKAAETVKAVGKSGTLRGVGKAAGRANMFGMVLDPALQVVRAWKYHFSSKDDYDKVYGAGSYDADHAATAKAEADRKAGVYHDPYNPSDTDKMMNRQMEMNKNGGKLNSVSGSRLLLRK